MNEKRSHTLTWLGSSAFRLVTADGKVVYIDPWLENSDCPTHERHPQACDAVLVSHGHYDHIGQTLELSQKFGCPVVAPQDVRRWLEKKGLERDDRLGPDQGGTVEVQGISVTLTDARHSGGAPDGSYGGAPCGMIIRPDADTRIYFAGDTTVFGDMALISRLYRPNIAILPIGGHYTMDPEAAAVALELLGIDRCIPCHYRAGAQPPPPRAVLPGKPDHLRALVPSLVRIVAPMPGETVDLHDAWAMPPRHNGARGDQRDR